MNRADMGDADETTVLPTNPQPHGAADAGRPDLTELLSAFDRFDGAQPAPATGARKPRTGGDAFTPREPRTAGESFPAAREPRHGGDAYPPAGGVREPGGGVRETPAAYAPAGGVRDTSAAYPPPGDVRDTSAAVQDPWGEPGDTVHTHDPHEVTIQLDSVGLQLDGSLRAAKGGAHGGGPDGSDGPVFVDESGRRSRRFRRLGMAVGLACAVYAVVIVATLLSGNSNAPWLPVQDPKKDTPAGQVDTTPLPGESAPSAGADGAGPGASPSVSDGVTLSPGADATAPDASGSAEETDAGTDPEPTATKKPTTGTGTKPTADPDPTDTATTPDPEPTPTDTGEPTPDPTETEGGDTAGTGVDTVAAGQAEPASVRRSVAAEPANPDTPYDPSPEHTL
ncbi:hypothetical protein [Streptomyces sp. NPDC003832]